MSEPITLHTPKDPSPRMSAHLLPSLLLLASKCWANSCGPGGFLLESGATGQPWQLKTSVTLAHGEKRPFGGNTGPSWSPKHLK